MNSLLTLQNLVHPLHTNIGGADTDRSDHSTSSTSRPLHIIGQLINDPWYTSEELRRRFRRGSESTRWEDIRAVAPDFDVRESEGHYFLEGEFPGVRDKEDVRIEWVGRRTLVIEAEVRRVDEEAEWGIDLGHGHQGGEASRTGEGGEADVEAQREKGEEQKEKHGEDSRHRHDRKKRREGLRFWLSERHTGVLQRSFTFPHDVDTESMRARLRDGLVKILVPKVRAEEREPPRRVYIED